MNIFSKNDAERKVEKTTAMSLIASGALSILLMVLKPSVGIITKDLTATFGAVMFGGTAIMSGPLFYKFASNISKEDASDK